MSDVPKLIIKEKSAYAISGQTEDGGWSFFAKWDGCGELRRYFNARDASTPASEGKEDEDVDQLHFCDLDELISLLERIRDEQQKLEMWISPGGGGE